MLSLGQRVRLLVGRRRGDGSWGEECSGEGGVAWRGVAFWIGGILLGRFCICGVGELCSFMPICQRIERLHQTTEGKSIRNRVRINAYFQCRRGMCFFGFRGPLRR